jgi:DNA-binding NtrC family response regulator
VSSPTVLFIDDDADVQKAASLLLRRHGITLLAARSPAEAFSVLAVGTVDVVLLDLNFAPGATSGAEGLACLDGLIAQDPDAVVVVVTGHSGVNIAVAAMRAGASDFVMKPWNNDRLVAALRDAADRRAHRRAARAAGAEPSTAGYDEPVLIGDSPAMRQVQALAHRVAAADVPVLVVGEPGSGKSLLAQIIHRHAPRAGAPLIMLDPAGIWSEGEAALMAALAAIDPAATVVLETIDALPLPVQTRLAAWLGSHSTVRVLSGARQHRPGLLAGGLNAALLDRLSTVDITLPPLRERGADAVLLAEHFGRVFARRHARPPPSLSDETRAAIAAAPWPGNVRELRQAMERAVVLSTGALLQIEDVLPAWAGAQTGTPATLPMPVDSDLTLERAERAAVQAALRRHGFNVSRAARQLGLTRAALYRRMAKHGF